jgi:hypothetical protein
VYVVQHFLTKFVVTLQSLILYNVSTYDYYITPTPESEVVWLNFHPN